MNTEQAIYLLEKYGIRPDPELGKKMCPEIGDIGEDEKVYQVSLEDIFEKTKVE
tara:strand:+ start:1766 stop:1927 length:162 start_codon:yes stop_codon:yes gene_type:complete